ncbi:hypothetical protein HYV31_03455 [candidate division WWE3 bacterium]|nr:hypothetical protein [candidate division WWE3 bacterium]
MRNNPPLFNSGSPEWISLEIVKLKTHTVSLFIFVFVVIGVLLGYYLVGGIFSSPFTKITYAQTKNTEMQVNVETKFPARTAIEYGTSSAYVNSIPITNTFKKTHSGQVAGLLPGADHTFRIVAYDSAGRAYYSDFYEVK